MTPDSIQIVAAVSAVVLLVVAVWLAVTAVFLAKRKNATIDEETGKQTSSLTPVVVALSVAAAVLIVQSVLAGLLFAQIYGEKKLAQSLAKPVDKLSFNVDIKPLFRLKDAIAMRQASSFDLHNYDDVSKNAERIYIRVEEGTMPCDEPWSADKVLLFRRWMDAGKPQ